MSPNNPAATVEQPSSKQLWPGTHLYAHRVLTAAEEAELAKTIEAGLYAQHLLDIGSWTVPASRAELGAIARDGRAAFETFVAANVRLASMLARRRLAVCTLSFEDLRSEALLGVIRAVQKFDYARGLKFSTYAWAWVRNFLQRAVIRAAGVSVPVGEVEQCNQILAAESDLIASLGRTPTIVEIAAAAGVSVRSVERARAVLAPALSLDAPTGPGDRGELTLADTLAAVANEGVPGEEDLRAIMARARLSDREIFVVSELFGLEDGTSRPVAEVASRRRVKPELVTRAAHTAMQKLRAAAADHLRDAA